MTTITDARLAEMVGAGVPCVPAQPGEIAAVVQELRRLRALTASRAQSVTDEQMRRGVEWFDANFNGLPHSQALVRGILEAAQLRARPVVPEQELADDILAELVRARAKFPGKNVTFAALVEEVGELATATFEESRERVRKEAVQVAVMAMRMVLDGDHTFDDWRESKGLDPLTPSALEGEGHDQSN